MWRTTSSLNKQQSKRVVHVLSAPYLTALDIASASFRTGHAKVG